MLKKQIRSLLLSSCTNQQLSKWFDPLSLEPGDEGSLVVYFPHALFAEWFKDNFQSVFEQNMESLPGGARFTYAIKKTSPGAGAGQTPLRGSPKNLGVKDEPRPQNGFADTAASFETFLFNRKNQFPVAAAKELACQGNNNQYNPFVIHAQSGCGKTHLLSAIAGEFIRNVTKNNIFLGTLYEFGTKIRNKSEKSINRNFEDYSALFLDNFQDCQEDQDMQNILVLTLDTFLNAKKTVAIAMDNHPAAYPGFSAKLRSRLEGGLLVEIKKPDLDVRRQYAQQQNDLLSLGLKKNDLLSVAQQYQEFRQIQGALRKVAAFKALATEDEPMDLDQLLKSINTTQANPLTKQLIIEKTARYFGLDSLELTGKGRKSNVASARQVAMYLCRELLGTPLSGIGESFGGKNHSTVIYAVNKITYLVKGNKDMHNIVSELKKLCTSL